MACDRFDLQDLNYLNSKTSSRSFRLITSSRKNSFCSMQVSPTDTSVCPGSSRARVLFLLSYQLPV